MLTYPKSLLAGFYKKQKLIVDHAFRWRIGNFRYSSSAVVRKTGCSRETEAHTFFLKQLILVPFPVVTMVTMFSKWLMCKPPTLRFAIQKNGCGLTPPTIHMRGMRYYYGTRIIYIYIAPPRICKLLFSGLLKYGHSPQLGFFFFFFFLQ